MKHHKLEWIFGGLIILIAIGIGTAIYSTQSTKNTIGIKQSVIKRHYQTWTKTYLKGGSQKFVKTNKATSQQTLSEAQGYGMVISVMAARQGFGDKKTFDQLTQYYLDHRISAENSLMDWRQKQKGSKMVSTSKEKSSATDGDLDIAYALILADQKWGSDGRVKYNQLASQILTDIREKEIDPITNLPRVGDWATDEKTKHLVRPSDLMTAYFRTFAKFTNDARWTKIAQSSQKALKKLSAKHSTGLMADFVSIQGNQHQISSVQPKQVASEFDAEYGFNACRIPWRVAYDYQLNHSHDSKKIVQKMADFFASKKQVTAVYQLDGQSVESYKNVAFTAPIAYAAGILGNKDLKSQYLSAMTDGFSAKEYYPDTIQMLTLVTSGELNNH